MTPASTTTDPSQTTHPGETPGVTVASTTATGQPSPGFSPILYRGAGTGSSYLVLGGVETGVWLSAADTAGRIYGGEQYDYYSLSGLVGRSGGVSATFNATCGGYLVEAGLVSGTAEQVGVIAAWPVSATVPVTIAIDNPTYQQTLADWLEGRGFVDPVIGISQILRVDIENDGADEVLISASYFADATGHTVQKGDYSLVILRRAVGSSVVTMPLVEDDYSSEESSLTFPFTYSIAGILDLDGRGDLEVAVGARRWEGYGAMLFQIDDLETKQVFKVTCTQ